VIEASGLTKSYGSKLAVDDLSFAVRPGVVTGFLGPNGSGKSTTMRLMLGLDRADEGVATFDGQRYRQLRRPLYEVGALLDAAYAHPSRKARMHLWAVAASNGIPKARVDEVLGLVGLTEVADKRVGTFSLGMRQRLGLAGAMLGDPPMLMFDEPANGLDPEGIRWIRDFLKYLAGQGRTVFVSSHQLTEVSLMAEDLVVIGQGRLIAESSVHEFVARFARAWVRVKSPQMATLGPLLRQAGAMVEFRGPEVADVFALGSDIIGELAARNGLVLHELSPQTGSLEDAYLEVTNQTVEFRAGQTA
jgi:ABC-2 type transport system ATP-binding protein